MPLYQVDYQIMRYGTIEVTRETEKEAIASVEEMIEGDGEIEKIEAILLDECEK